MTLNESQSDLFRFIRNEDVVLFVGAGFSAYAGYPLGSQLGTVLHGMLPTDLRSIDHNKSLDQFTEAIVRKCKSRDLLNTLLDRIFLTTASSTSDHDLLATIPHFKTIITTNYDTLFEDAYGDRANLMWLDEHIGQWDNKKVNILKIHGHIRDKSSIVLTQEDYSNFIAKDFSSPLWTAVLNQIGTRHVLFIGYGYEDPNIWSLIKKLRQQLGAVKKRMFLVGRGNDPDKLAFYANKGIKYIQQNATTLLQALCADIMDNLINDLEAKRVSAETARAFSRARNASLTLEDTADGYRLKSIDSIIEKDRTWDAKFSYQNGSETMHRIHTFQNSVNSLEMRLESGELKNFRLAYEGFKLLDQDELAFIVVKKIPKKVRFDLTFLTEGWEANGLEAKIFAVKDAARIQATIRGLEIEIFVTLANSKISLMKFDLKRPELHGLVNDEILLYTLILHFFSQKEFTIFFSDGTALTYKAPEYQVNTVRECGEMLTYLSWLKLIERTFGMRFGAIGIINDDSCATAKSLVNIINGHRVPIKGKYVFDGGLPDDEAMAYFEKLNALLDDGPLEFLIRQDRQFNLHGHQFICSGKQVTIEQPLIDNLEAVRSGIDKSLVFSSRNGKIWERLTVDPPPELIEEN